MDLRTHTRTCLAVLALALVVAPATANELRSSARARVTGIMVHDAAETLREYCRNENGQLVLVLPGGSRWELVTETTDPAITNPGDGAFHVYETAEVEAALAAVDFPLRGISAEVFILPYLRRASLESAAGPGVILLSPGVRKLSREHQHSEFVHELGHVIQYTIMPDTDAQAWDTYMNLRGLDANEHQSGSPHADRPHEIWAEDFRALFGGAVATSNGTIENADLAYPTQVAGLDQFMQTVAANAAMRVNANLIAAPLGQGAVTFSRPGQRASVLDVFDAQGRRLASVEPTVAENAIVWNWNGRSVSGAPIASGVVFARARDAQGGATRVTVVR